MAVVGRDQREVFGSGDLFESGVDGILIRKAIVLQLEVITVWFE